MKNLDRIRKQLSPERRRRIKARAADILTGIADPDPKPTRRARAHA